ncbi:MAG: hypothetical protein QOJ29_2386, partial [Thermoleophilaceae bacterium]|nr:hypothetical protein [Thermoleophilaceae bacterium]
MDYWHDRFVSSVNYILTVRPSPNSKKGMNRQTELRTGLRAEEA